MPDQPDKKSPTEPLDLQRKIQDTLASKRPIESSYPYFPPHHEIPFLHIGTEKQLFLDNFILNRLQDVERGFPEPYRSTEPMLEVGDLPQEQHANPIPAGAPYDSDDKKFKLWYTQSLTSDLFNKGQVLCCAGSPDCIHWEKLLSEACLPHQEHRATNIVE